MGAPVAIEKEYGLLNMVPGLPKRGYQYGDYAEWATTAVWSNYVIGTNAYLNEAVRYAQFAINPMIAGSPGFVSDETAVIVTQDTYMRINTATNVIRRILLANSPYIIREKTFRIYVQRVAVNGAIYILAEGNIVRTP